MITWLDYSIYGVYNSVPGQDIKLYYPGRPSSGGQLHILAKDVVEVPVDPDSADVRATSQLTTDLVMT